MVDLVAAIGLALVIEGILCAGFPDGVRRAMYEAAHTPSDRMRVVGIISAVLGVLVVWGARQFG
jgi:uncharacterized protein YjeT (DUF2065 family)